LSLSAMMVMRSALVTIPALTLTVVRTWMAMPVSGQPWMPSPEQPGASSRTLCVGSDSCSTMIVPFHDFQVRGIAPTCPKLLQGCL
jgi:hypothetical protein